MIRIIAVVVSLLLASVAVADEMDGLNSRAIDISRSFSAPFDQYGAAFIWTREDGTPDSIAVQSRFTNASLTSIACERRIGLPPDVRQVSHPALSTSGWLFISATTDPAPGATAWNLYAMRRSGGPTQCHGWDTGWIELGAYPGRQVASAPDAVVAYDVYTYVFVTDRSGGIGYLMFDEDASRNPNGWWTEWRLLRATDNATPTGIFAASKPAAAIHIDHSLNRLHVFWVNPARDRVQHVKTTVSIFGYLVEETPDERPLSDGSFAVRARTACTAGPEATTPDPLFVVCGINPVIGSSDTSYAIARYEKPLRAWSSAEANVTWDERSAYGGYTLPSLGRSYLTWTSLMFVTFGTRFCPQPEGPDRIPSKSCFYDAEWVIQNRYSGGPSGVWERSIYEWPIRATSLR